MSEKVLAILYTMGYDSGMPSGSAHEDQIMKKHKRGDRKTAIELIESAGPRFISATFIKKDGSERLMTIQPLAIQSRMVGDAASDSAKQATATRQANHPELFPVVDVRAISENDKGIRCINLDTLKKLVVNGETHEFE